MPNRRRLIVCSDEVWALFRHWGQTHGIEGYNRKVTVEATIAALLELAALVEEQ